MKNFELLNPGVREAQPHRDLCGSETWPRLASIVFAVVISVGLGSCSRAATESTDQIKKPEGVAQLVNSSEKGPYHSAGLDRQSLQNPTVQAAMSRVARHEFVPEEVRPQAYDDRALSIGRGQTISQPYIVALMTEQAQITPGSKVLEVGTGSGYQAAVLAELGATVFTIEIVPELAARAAETLHRLGFDSSVKTRQGDGSAGWPEEGPFDAILVTASSPRLPPKLIAQLANHGRLIIPIEEENHSRDGERLIVIERNGDDLITRDLGPVKFVPLTGSVRQDKIDPPKSATESVLQIEPDSTNESKSTQSFVPAADEKLIKK